ncbi:uncharacterized protein LOC127289259 isoform X2 [Leptopilina boulardi]|nr:uncharacterized protein LOC127289259 isoform X2 [Leptopilina boulardi]
MSTDCEEPYCINEPCLMDYGPDFIGNWQDVYNENNKKANRELLLGILSVIFALLIINHNGMVKGYYSPLFDSGSW